MGLLGRGTRGFFGGGTRGLGFLGGGPSEIQRAILLFLPLSYLFFFFLASPPPDGPSIR